mmetsp:Transcript_44139/g.139267  ORF Transcript_44139/g.139267 Transcript_44139/m.139267 type:complete len:281 (-) Transcript_44139:50-892(-)
MRTGGANLLVVEANDGGHVRIFVELGTAGVTDQGLQGGEAVGLIVQPGRAEELVLEAPDLFRLSVIQGQVKILDGCCRATKLLRKSRQQFWSMAGVCSLRRGLVQLLIHHGKDRYEVGLLVEIELCSLIGSLQMNAQTGNAEDRPLHVDKLPPVHSILLHNRTPCQGQLPVEPSMPKSTSVAFDSKLHVSRRILLRHRLDLQYRAVCVGSDNLVSTSLLHGCAHCKGHDGTGGPDVEVLARGRSLSLKLPHVVLWQSLEACSHKHVRCCLHHLVGRRRRA